MAYSYARRNELAIEKGFSSYTEYRHAIEYANKAEMFTNFLGDAGGRSGENVKEAKVFYDAFSGKHKETKPYGAEGAMTKWWVGVMGYNAATWAAHYPNGVRG